MVAGGLLMGSRFPGAIDLEGAWLILSFRCHVLAFSDSAFLRRLCRPHCVADGLLIQRLFQHVPLCDDREPTPSFFSTVTRDIDRYPGALIFICILERVAVVSYTALLRAYLSDIHYDELVGRVHR